MKLTKEAKNIHGKLDLARDIKMLMDVLASKQR
jgi:hypothetical protein